MITKLPPNTRLHSFLEIDLEIFSTIILSLPLIQEGQLFASGKQLKGLSLPRKKAWFGKLTTLDMTFMG